MFGPIRHLVFDFDGTLVNTMPSVIRGLRYAIHVANGRDVPVDELVATFGAAPQAILAKWLAPELVPVGFKAWLDFEDQLAPSEIAPFPGVVEMLDDLQARKIPTAIFTGRDRLGTLRILRAHGWLGRYFDDDRILAGDDGHPTKPSPEGLAELMKRLGFEPARTLRVGDHVYDAMAGAAAGTRTAAALWDLPEGQGTARSRFRQAWQKWDKQPCDLRLIEPASLTAWLKANPS
jgi:phosphoglycolate phosphatase-like HAD superfamily hydrolase